MMSEAQVPLELSTAASHTTPNLDNVCDWLLNLAVHTCIILQYLGYLESSGQYFDSSLRLG